MIETASIASYALPDGLAKAKLRNAPSTVKARVDATRRERGLAPLFTEKAIARSAHVAAQPRRPKVARTLVGIAAPGLSQPCWFKGDSRECREMITAAAWDGVADAIRSGTHFKITDGHGGKVIATSADETLKWRVDSRCGLVFQLDLLRANDVVWPAGMDCSIGMTPLKWSHRYLNGSWVRCIESMRLDHIALLRPSQRREGAYSLAKVLPAKPGEAGRVALQLCIETLRRLS
jgi:hypothetical protein